MTLKSLIFISFIFIMACSQAPKQPAVKLILKPQIGKSERSQYHSRTLSRIYRDEMLNKKTEEQLDFKIKAKPTRIQASLDPAQSAVIYHVVSYDKSGEGQLNEFAFPEIGEKIEFSMSRTAEVFDVKGKDKDSVFYVPPISLPKVAVEVGDTWVMKKTWKTDKQAIPLRVEVTSILKEISACHKSQCALIEVSGTVDILDLSDQARLDSQISGWAIFDIHAGRVLWSFVESEQTLTTEKFKTELENCLTSYSIDTKWEDLKNSVEPFCRIGRKLTRKDIPGFQ